MAKKNRMPKRIAGVIPIPKVIRKPTNKLMKTDMGRNLLADALVALASGIIGTRYVKEQAAAAVGEMREQAGTMMDKASSIYGDMGGKKKKKKNKDRDAELRRH
jgi:hypothetical protein